MGILQVLRFESQKLRILEILNFHPCSSENPLQTGKHLIKTLPMSTHNECFPKGIGNLPLKNVLFSILMHLLLLCVKKFVLVYPAIYCPK